jgi:hypothetical protein
LLDKLQGIVGWQAWYLDDAHIMGTPEQLERAVRLIVSEGPRIGVGLNLAKCRLWGPAFVEHGEGILQGIPVEPFTAGTGIRALGAPVCHPGGTR